MNTRNFNKRYHLILFVSLIFIMLFLFASSGAAATGATFTVNTTGNNADLNPGDGHCDTSVAKGDQCTLMAAIEESNANTTTDLIVFSGITNITPSSPLPALNTDDRTPTTIYGAGAVTIDGSSAGAGANGFVLRSNSHKIQGLTITNFDGCGISITGDGAIIGTNGDETNDALEGNVISGNGSHGICINDGNSNKIAGNKIGTNAAGDAANPNGGMGISIVGDSDNNRIGTNGDNKSDILERNLISGNEDYGIGAYASGVNIANTIIAGNYIGVNAAGTAAIPNAYEGISLQVDIVNTRIGTDGNGQGDIAERNLISGNHVAGINSEGSGATIAGNYIGVDVTGEVAIPNEVGIYAGDGDTIGTNADGQGDEIEGNLVSGNKYDGIVVDADNVVVAGNFIGLNAQGDTAIPNNIGVEVGGEANRIGGTQLHEGNLISGNAENGIELSGDNNWIVNNRIGTDADGSFAIPNGCPPSVDSCAGIYLGSSGNTIGTNGDGVDDDREGNLISGNDNNGIYIDGVENVIAGNYIGVNASGMQKIPNDEFGIHIDGSNHNRIGTNGDGVSDSLERNIISGNNRHGIFIEGSTSWNNTIAGNYIGTNANGDGALGGYENGIYISGAPDNIIGTNGDGNGDEAERNVISGNGSSGINISNSTATNTIIAGNYIGLTAAGDAALKNGDEDWGEGIYISNAPNTRIGTNGDGISDNLERNVVSGNNIGGIQVSGDGSHHTVIAGNYIGTDATGMVAIPNGVESWNGDQAVMVYGASARIGTNGDGVNDTAERNVISGNYGWGIRVFEGSSDTLIAGNYIGVDASGSTAMGNGKSGIYLDRAYGVSVGGTSAAMQNIIANNNGDGITIGSAASSTIEINDVVRGNSIYANSDLGIDLGNDGATANDSNDSDTGPNDLQNFPVLTAATGDAESTTIVGSLNSEPSEEYWLDFYVNNACDPSGFGEGYFYLGSYTVTTSMGGDASFTAEFPTAISDGYKVTAIATGTDKGSSSEFSQCVTGVSTYVPPALSIADSSLAEGDSGSTEMVFIVSLSAPAETTINVQYGTGGSTATPKVDYNAASGILTFSTGQSSKTINVSILGDEDVENNETLMVTLSNAFNATIADGIATGTILDDDRQGYSIFLPIIIR
jgi:parallel beta-helix repeat protein